MRNLASQSKRAAVLDRPSAYAVSLAQARLPVKGNEPNEPAFTLPFSASPLTVPLNSSVIGNGVVMAFFQDTLLPSTLPSVIGCERPCADCVPVSVVPSALSSRVEGCGPMGDWTTISYLPSTDMGGLLLMPHLKDDRPVRQASRLG